MSRRNIRFWISKKTNEYIHEKKREALGTTYRGFKNYGIWLSSWTNSSLSVVWSLGLENDRIKIHRGNKILLKDVLDSNCIVIAIILIHFVKFLVCRL